MNQIVGFYFSVLIASQSLFASLSSAADFPARAPAGAAVAAACDQQPGRVKVTQYFSGRCAQSIEGTSHGKGNYNNAVIPCFSVACPKGGGHAKGKYIRIPGLKGLKCSPTTPIGSAESIVARDPGARPYVKCSSESCENTEGIVRCDDVGGGVQAVNHFDLYLGNCQRCGKGDTCMDQIPGQQLGPLSLQGVQDALQDSSLEAREFRRERRRMRNVPNGPRYSQGTTGGISGVVNARTAAAPQWCVSGAMPQPQPTMLRIRAGVRARSAASQ